MAQSPTITNANPEKLIDLINRATYRVVYIAPGIDKAVAFSLTQKWLQLGGDNVTVVLDVNSEVCRLGYGTLEGLKMTKEAAQALSGVLCHQPGIRIGVLISDETTLIYSPTPLLIEAESNNPQQPNAIELASPPKELANDVGLGDEPNFQRRVGLDSLGSERIEQVEQELKQNPPAKFDLARKVQVFTSYFQFVELEMRNCFVSRKKVPIPSALMGFGKNSDVERSLHAHFDLLPPKKLEVRDPNNPENVITEETIQEARKRIEANFMIHLKGYGTVVRVTNKEDLFEEIMKLEEMIEVFSKGVKTQLGARTERNKRVIVDTLTEALFTNPPPAYMKVHGKDGVKRDTLKDYIAGEVETAFLRAGSDIDDMKLRLVFKNVAYESLHDLKFLKVVKAAMPGLDFFHEEYEAARSAKQPLNQLSIFD